MPQMGESIAEGTLVRWIKKVGETVDRDEPLFEISTDKVDAEIPSPAAGVLTVINVKEGETAAVNSVVAMIGEAGGSAVAPETRAADQKREAPSPAASAATVAPAAQVGKAPARGNGGQGMQALTPDEARREKSSPLVRRLAREHQVDITHIAGTGLDGRVTKNDFLRHIQMKPGSAPRPGTPAAAMSDRVEPMSVMRKKIAEHMILSRRTSAHVHSVFHVNFTPWAAYACLLRSRIAAALEKSTSYTECTWADVRRLNTMCSAIFLRITDIGTVSVFCRDR